MHRDSLLSQLHWYLKNYPAEQSTVERFNELIAQNPRCFERDCWAGHITASVWLLNRSATQVLLTHHKKLNRWLQLGGHSDGDGYTLGVALREAHEESGLEVMPYERGVNWTGSLEGELGGDNEQKLKGEIFDIDVHAIPARADEPGHSHFDVRFIVQAVDSESYLVSDESHDLAWVNIDELERYTQESSILRMRSKWRLLAKLAK